MTSEPTPQPLPVELVRKVEETATEGQANFCGTDSIYAIAKTTAANMRRELEVIDRSLTELRGACSTGSGALGKIRHIARDWLRAKPAGAAGVAVCLAVLGCGAFASPRHKPGATVDNAQPTDGMAAARIALKAKDYEGAAKMFSAARAAGADSVESWFQQANAWYSSGEHDAEALACARELKRLPGGKGKGHGYHIEGAVCERQSAALPDPHQRAAGLTRARDLYRRAAAEGFQMSEGSIARVSSLLAAS